MKSKTVIIGTVVALLIIGSAVFYVLTKDKSDIGDAEENNTAGSSQSVEQADTPKEANLSDALATIGAAGNEGPVNGNTYTFSGVEYKFDEPSSWSASMNQRKQACEQGYINTGYQVATDGSTWFATTNYNEDLAALVNALKGAGIDAEVASYC